MKTKVLLTFAGALLMTGLVVTLTGCNGDPAGPTPVAVDDGVVDAVENQRYCPVMPGMEIDRSIYVDHEGERVYFCCAGCPPAFEADPERYMEILHEIHEDPDAREEHGDDDDHDHHHHH